MRAAFLLGALPVLASAALFDAIERLPRGWSFHRDAQADEPIRLRIHVKEQNVDSFEKLFWEISSPEHENYGKHLSQRDVQKMLAPTEESAGSVVDWLRANHVEHISIDGAWVNFKTTVGQANEMLGTTFTWFKNEEKGEAHLRTTEYSVPSGIAEHINFVSPTLKFPGLRRMKSNVHASKDDDAVATFMEWVDSLDNPASALTTYPGDTICAKTITPQCLLGLYNIHYAAKNGSTKAAYGSFLNEYARYTDLTLFTNTIAPYASGSNFTVKSFNGGGNDQSSTSDSTEANLDNQYLISVAYPIPIMEFSTAGCGPIVPDQDEAAGSCSNEPYTEFVTALSALSDAELPQTLSISYGEDEQSWPEAEAKQICSEFMKLGARGLSIMFSSGDSGPGKTCENNDGSKVQFVPAFPASCPYVTTVGATQSVKPEVVASFSGGGFSNYFAQPSYQSTAVAGYIKALNGAFSQYYNKSGRAYPDVAAQGVNYLVVDKGITEPVDGTSASSPTFAGVVALLNSARKTSGQSPLGFLNPLLYKSASAFNDITSGTSSGCSSGNKPISNAGFKAVAGWDAATGLGTPDFGKLLAIVAPKECNVGGVIANPTQSTCAGKTATSMAVGTKTTMATVKTASTTKMVTKPSQTGDSKTGISNSNKDGGSGQ